jgi:hypothetical protein
LILDLVECAIMSTEGAIECQVPFPQRQQTSFTRPVFVPGKLCRGRGEQPRHCFAGFEGRVDMMILFFPPVSDLPVIAFQMALTWAASHHRRLFQRSE